MPPKGAPVPAAGEREQAVQWLRDILHNTACADGISPAPFQARRLNRAEYASTVRDLLNIHINAGFALPADGAGGEGFDNAAETLFLSPIHGEKYLDAARLALEYAFKDPRSKGAFLTARPGAELSADAAARQVLERFLPRAYRRPVKPQELERAMALFRTALQRDDSYESAVRFALTGVLLSPNFLFRIEESNPAPEPALVDSYAMASRLSYFLWGSMPDQTLVDLAAANRLQDTGVLKEQVKRLLKDQKSREFAERFIEQWLGTRELGRDIKPDAKLFSAFYDEEIQSGIRYEPVLFFQEILAQNLSLLNLLDSRFTILTNKLARHYGFASKDLKQQPTRFELPEGSHRGGLTGMAAVLAVSSYPHRTSPVLRGKWVLDALLGTPVPPPPPEVPALREQQAGDPPKTMRERLSQHRANAVCASCHDRMDPIGFALENFDVAGRWRDEEAGRPIDAQGELPDGTVFRGPDELRRALVERKDLFVRNLASRMMGYALGRGLTMEDQCALDRIAAQVKISGYQAQVLVEEIVLSVPFRYRPGTSRELPAGAP